MADKDAQREIALLRLVAQGVAGSRRDSPERTARRLLCLQAQDYWSGVASVALRSGTSIAAVEAAFNAGTLVRGWPLRGTLHLVGASDLGWLRELLAGRELAAAARLEARLGIDSHLLGRAERIAVETLSSDGAIRSCSITYCSVRSARLVVAGFAPGWRYSRRRLVRSRPWAGRAGRRLGARQPG